MARNAFSERHLGPRESQITPMLNLIGFSSIEELISATIPQSIRLDGELNLAAGLTEQEYLAHMSALAGKNEQRQNYIGLGYSPTFIPPTIQRNILENPGWYTAYTPYQAEIAQGRLEALLNFQTMISDLTKMEIANASLLDEGTAAAEAMMMFMNTRSRDKVKAEANKFFVDQEVYPQTLDVMLSRARALKIDVVVGSFEEIVFDASFFGALVQYPDGSGQIHDYRSFVEKAHALDIKVAAAADIMSLVLLTPPGEWGADAVVGNSQRFGVPMGYGGPHAAYFATKDEYKRSIPGRIIGVSQDRHGNNGYRMALQTREQHIRREKATSNICTAQALLAVMAGMYAVYHGAIGLQKIATTINEQTQGLANVFTKAGITLGTKPVFDTLKLSGVDSEAIKTRANQAGMNLRYYSDGAVGISLGEGITQDELNQIAQVVTGDSSVTVEAAKGRLDDFLRSDAILTHPVFSLYRSETEMMRYMKRLENRDLSLTHSMISLGSCTMKLNAASELMPITWPEFANMHPFAPVEQTSGYQELLSNLASDLCEITGFHSVSLQPNSGAQGEYAGLKVIMAYHQSRGEGHRHICLIPASAHGTNPASAVIAGMEVVVVKCDEKGNVEISDLKAKAEHYRDELAAFMITYPSTHGVFEEAIIEINQIIHDNGGQVYMDGANMNAQVGLTNPGRIGADVCHLNLHKTFAIPHGGGGPGMGPIGVAEHLAPFLPGNPLIDCGGDQAIHAISAAPWGSALILLISYGYIKMLGRSGVKQATEVAILNANYIKAKIKGEYDILYSGKNGTVAHEMIVDCRAFKNSAGIEVADIAKRLIDYGFHAPTVSFPVAGTLMIEPTESESKEELDRFCEALLLIREEIRAIVDGKADAEDNVLKMSPHTCPEVTADEWTHPYSRRQAAFPMGERVDFKFWPQVARVDNAFGDRNLICVCPPLEAYTTEIEAKVEQV